MSEPQRLGRVLPSVAASLSGQSRPRQQEQSVSKAVCYWTGVVRAIEEELMALAPRMLRRRLPDAAVERLASVLVEGVRVVVADERSRDENI